MLEVKGYAVVGRWWWGSRGEVGGINGWGCMGSKDGVVGVNWVVE